jgi:polyisoprenoid-binding protein YceI
MVMKRSASVLIVSTCIALPFAAHAGMKHAGDTDIKFEAKGPAGMKINGTSEQSTASEKDGKIVISVPVSSLRTGIGLRDKHLKGYLNADKCPNITLSVARSSVKIPGDDKEVEGEGTGDFTMNCVTKPMAFKYKAKRTGSDYHVQAFFKGPVDITKHDIEVPCYLGVCVDKDVKVKAKFKLRDGK